MRHKRSQNAGVAYTPVDEVMARVDALMRISSRTHAITPERRKLKQLDEGIGKYFRIWADLINPESVIQS
jgi:hypothetical protein